MLTVRCPAVAQQVNVRCVCDGPFTGNHPVTNTRNSSVVDMQSRYDLELKRDHIGPELDAITPLAAA